MFALAHYVKKYWVNVQLFLLFPLVLFISYIFIHFLVVAFQRSFVNKPPNKTKAKPTSEAKADLTVNYRLCFDCKNFTKFWRVIDATEQVQKQSPEGVLLKDVRKILAKLTEKHLCRSLFFNISLKPATSLKKETLTQVFSCEFCNKTFFTEHLRVAASASFNMCYLLYDDLSTNTWIPHGFTHCILFNNKHKFVVFRIFSDYMLFTFLKMFVGYRLFHFLVITNKGT